MFTFKPSQYLHPKYWPIWLALGLVKLIALLPWKAQQQVGSGIGKLLYWVFPNRRAVVRTNLKLCFPDLSDTEVESLIKQNFVSLGKGIIEMGMSWHMSDEDYKALCTIEGKELLDEALSQGNVLLLGVHFSSLDSGARYLRASGYPIQGLYKPAKNPLFEAYMTHQRNKRYRIDTQDGKYEPGLIPNKESKRFTARLKNGLLSWYAPDQSFHRHVIHAPFFGIETASLTSTGHLCGITNAQVLPMFGIRTQTGYAIHVLPALKNFPSGDEYSDTVAINQAIEHMIRYAPEQYLWLHKRFKHMPDGKNPYSK